VKLNFAVQSVGAQAPDGGKPSGDASDHMEMKPHSGMKM
jgi:hypothetical protein